MRTTLILCLTLALLALPFTALAIPPGFRVDEMVVGLNHPVAFAFAPDGRIFISERIAGEIRVVDRGALLKEPFATVQISASGERGLLGIALDPGFATNGFLYVFHSVTTSEQRITRFRAEGNHGVDETIIKDGIPASVLHNGGSIGFGPDGKLYFTVGDTGNPELARKIFEIPGKLHRVNADGSLPDDNPWPRASAFCLGCRNSFDFTFRPSEVPVVIYASENGPIDNDEINRIVAGQDYGWPLASGVTHDEIYIDPIYTWSPTRAPVGIAYYVGHNFPLEYNGDLFVAEYTTGNILRLHLNDEGTAVLQDSAFLNGEYGLIYDLVVAPDGTLWFSTASSLYRIVNDHPPQSFVRGNVDGTNGIDAHDAALLLSYILTGHPVPYCMAAADVNDDNLVDPNDVTVLLSFIYGAMTHLPTPFPECGLDYKSELSCESQEACQ